MKKIASFCFNTEKENIGGAQVPAVAFKRWCDILNIQCELVTNKKIISEYLPEFKIIKSAEELNDFDAVFFSTPGKLDFEAIQIPFTVMVHAEFDKNFYADSFYESTKFSNFVTVIGENYWNFRHQNIWYPCCLPEYLVNDRRVRCDNKDGVVYSARLSTWKNAHLLALLSKDSRFIEKFGEVKIFGKANKSKYSKRINAIDEDINEEIYNGYDIQESRLKFSQYKYFWDVSGNFNYNIKLLRFNLACVEAMKFGCVPIIKPQSVPEKFRDYCINIYDIIDDRKVFLSYETLSSSIYNSLLESNYSFYAVKKQVINILCDLNIL